MCFLEKEVGGKNCGLRGPYGFMVVFRRNMVLKKYGEKSYNGVVLSLSSF